MLYQSIATRLTIWENHTHQSTYNTSLMLKTFVLAGYVAYLGLGLSAFVYVPFGEEVMSGVWRILSGDCEWVGTEEIGWWGWIRPVGSSSSKQRRTDIFSVNQGGGFVA